MTQSTALYSQSMTTGSEITKRRKGLKTHAMVGGA